MDRLNRLGAAAIGVAILAAPTTGARAENDLRLTAPASPVLNWLKRSIPPASPPRLQLAQDQVPPGEVPRSRPQTPEPGGATLLPRDKQLSPAPRRAQPMARLEGEGGSAAVEGHGAKGSAVSKKTGEILLPGAREPVKLTYEVVNGQAILEGDMVLGSAAKVEQFSLQRRSCRGADCPWTSRGGRRRPESYRWPGGVIPYRVDPRFSPELRQRVRTAIQRVASRTRMILRPHRGERDFVTYRPVPNGCTASVGRMRGGQFVNLASRCTAGNSIHETLHAAGLLHEQSRGDRDRYVRILWANVIPSKSFNLKKLPGRTVDFGPYDYGSIMHYSARGFGRRGPDGRPMLTIQVLRPGVRIGQRRAMSRLDIASVNNLVAHERCIDLPRSTPRVVRTRGNIVLAGRRHWFANFGRSAAQAARAAAIMRAHRIDRVCLIGRGTKIRAQLLLSRGHPPARGVRGEVCNRIDAGRARVRSVRGRWWVVQARGTRLFGIAAFDNSTDALRAHDVIQHFRMRYVCNVGKLSTALTYFRR